MRSSVALQGQSIFSMASIFFFQGFKPHGVIQYPFTLKWINDKAIFMLFP